MKDTKSKVEATLIIFASGIIGPEEACDRIMSAFDYSGSSDKIICPECDSDDVSSDSTYMNFCACGNKWR